MSEFINRNLNVRPPDCIVNPAITNAPAKAAASPAFKGNTTDLRYANTTHNQLALSNNAQDFAKRSRDFKLLNDHLDTEGKLILLNLMEKKKLLSRESTDGSSTLENLCKIIREPRLQFFDKKNIVKDTMKTIADPYIITQNFGYVPEKIVPGFVNFAKGHTCPAASIEFDLADRRPAEFARYVEGLTSPRKNVKTMVKYSDLLPDRQQAVQVLTDQHTDYRVADWETFEVSIKPDDNAYIRADVQEDYKRKNTRSMIDVLMQSAFMQLGSHASYNSLTDERSPETGDGRGLNQFEIAFVESIVDSKSRKMPVVYMELDDNATKILKYEYDPKTTKKQLMDALDKGHNIITGFLVNMDDKNNIITPDGHEILLTGYEYDKNGKLMFKYNDTDDGDHFAPSYLEADSFIPTIHHANVPMEVLSEQERKLAA